MEDEKIIDLFFERSEQGIRELDIKYGKVCHNLSYHIVGSQRDAEECVDDAYLGAWNAIPPAKPNPLLTYVCKIVRNISPKIYWRKEAAKRSCHYTIALEEMRVLSREEQTRFVSCLLDDMDTCKFGVLLTLFTGVRIGELCALQWGNISLKEQTIRIDATLQRLRDTSTADNPGSRTRIVIGTPKSDTSIRTIPITDYTAELCGKMNPHSSAAYVLTGTENYMEPRALQYRMEKYTRECGLEGVHFHTLRHTFATRAVEVGFEIKSLSEVLGHATTTITLDRYVHSSLILKRDNMKKLNAVGF